MNFALQRMLAAFLLVLLFPLLLLIAAGHRQAKCLESCSRVLL